MTSYLVTIAVAKLLRTLVSRGEWGLRPQPGGSPLDLLHQKAKSPEDGLFQGFH